jgi:hypothetical protein
MKDVDRALADISDIRSQLAAGTMFRGFGPAVMALSGGAALAAAIAQSLWPTALAANHAAYLTTWLATAIVAALFISAEVYARSHRHHGGLADSIVLSAFEQFLPAGFAGLALTAVIWKFAPIALWTLPGLWQVFLALGIFAGSRSLPRAVRWIGGWYFVTGFAVLMLASSSAALSPWLMGAPFAIGQLALAAVLHFAYGEYHADKK